MELSRTSTRLFFTAAMNVMFSMYSVFEKNWFNGIVSLMNFFVILHAFAMVENAIEEAKIKQAHGGET
jgi:hypothetical protein